MDAFDSILSDLYDGVAAPEQLSSAVTKIQNLAGASSAMLFTQTVPVSAGGVWVHTNCDHEVLTSAAYVDYYSQKDPWFLAAKQKGLDAARLRFNGDDLVDFDALLKSEIYNDVLQRMDMARICGGFLSAGEAVAALSLFRPAASEAFSAETDALLRRLLPHVQRALRLRAQLWAGPQGLPGWSEALLDQLRFGLFGLDRNRSVRLMNAAGRRIAAAGDGLIVRRQRIIAEVALDQRSLEAAVARAVSAEPEGADLLINRPSGLRPYLVSIAPLTSDGSDRLGLQDVRAVVYAFDPSMADAEMLPSSDPAARRLSAFFNLSGAETRVAAGLLLDHTIAELAGRHGVSVETVRSQVKSLLSKTETSRQSQLVKRLAEALVLPSTRATRDG